MGFGQEDGEFFAAIAAYKIVLANVLTEQLGYLPQDFVSQKVSEFVIELLEMIDVDHQQRKPEAVAFGGGERFDDASLEATPVVDAGEAVGRGHGLGLVQLHRIA